MCERVRERVRERKSKNGSKVNRNRKLDTEWRIPNKMEKILKENQKQAINRASL